MFLRLREFLVLFHSIKWKLVPAILLIVIVFSENSTAQDLTVKSVISTLVPEKINSNGTRSFSFTVENSGISKNDRAFLEELSTRSRAIIVVEREKIDEIIKSNKLPKIDIGINFEHDSDLIKGAAFDKLDVLGKALLDKSLRTSKVLLNGHTDASGEPKYNQELSERRAKSVVRYLVGRFSIDERRLISSGYGEERLLNRQNPLADENRRVEVVNLGSE